MQASLDAGAQGARELAITRFLPAAPEAVFAAWTDPAQIPLWWGPYGMTTPACEIELRPGGRFFTLMRDPAGKEYPNLCVIDAVTAPSRLEVRVPAEAGGPLVGAAAIISFAPHPCGTRLDVRWRHPTAEMRAAHEAMGFFAGWGQTLDRLSAHVMGPAEGQGFGPPPAPEHGWLHRMLGEWRYEAVCDGPPGQAQQRATGTEQVRALGGYWVQGEGEGECPGGMGHARTLVTMGFDPGARRFRGTWVGSMMAHMFVYDGTLDAAAQVLTLESEGPSMSGEGLSRYRDTVEMLSDAHRRVTSAVQEADGDWRPFMTADFRRTG